MNQGRPNSNRIARVVACLLLFAGLRLYAQHFSLSQWGHKDGLPSATIYAIAQTPDGFLWLGTADGLIRYDGFQFVQLSFDRFGLRPLGQIRALLAAQDGALLAGNESGVVVRLREGMVVTRSFGSPVIGLAGLPGGAISVKTADGRVQCLRDTLTVPDPSMTCLQASTLKGQVAPGSGLDVWGAGEDARTKALVHKIGLSATIHKLVEDRRGELWVATANRGAFLIRNGTVAEHFTRASGLAGDKVWDIFEDREGNLWMGTQNGLTRIRANKFLTFTARNRLSGSDARDLASGRDGALWIGSSAELAYRPNLLRPGRSLREGVSALLPDGAGGAIVLANGRLQMVSPSGRRKDLSLQAGQTALIARSSDGTTWINRLDGGLQSLEGPHALVHIFPPLSSGKTITKMAGGPGHELWLATEDGELLRHDERGEHSFTSKEGLQQGKIAFLSPQPNGTLWIATDAGLEFYDGHGFLHWDRGAGLPGDLLLWAVPDQLGHLWLGYNFGVAEISISDLKQQAAGTRSQVHYDLYDDGDGLEGNPEVHGQMPVTQTTDGGLWFTISEGLARIDPAHVTQDLPPPLTHILQLTADGVDVPLDHAMKLKPLTRTIALNYTGVSLSAPRKVRYRYRLDGFDDHWQEGAARRTATYTNLKPGFYRFRVLASTNDTAWNASEATLGIDVLPAYYQTAWFKTACSLLAVAFLALLYRLRLQRNANLLRVRYEDRLAERNRVAQDLHDNLIQAMIGVGLQLEIADEVTPGDAPAKKSVTRALKLTQVVVGTGRATLQTLRRRPLGLAEVKQMMEDAAKAIRIEGTVQLRFASLGAEKLLAADVGDDMLQIGREALRNAVLHSGSDEVTIRTEFNAERFTLVVSDRGRGFSAQGHESDAPGHYGIRGMRERALRIGAALELRTSPDAGTEWRLTIPKAIAYQLDEDAGRSSVRSSVRDYLARWKRPR